MATSPEELFSLSSAEISKPFQVGEASDDLGNGAPKIGVSISLWEDSKKRGN